MYQFQPYINLWTYTSLYDTLIGNILMKSTEDQVSNLGAEGGHPNVTLCCKAAMSK